LAAARHSARDEAVVVDGSGRLVAPRVPIAHGDEGADLVPLAREAVAQLLLEGFGLGLGVGQQRRAAAQVLVDLPRDGGATARDRLGNQPAQGTRQADDCRIVEEIEQEGLDGVGRIGSAEIE
jgi:transposase